MNGNLQDLVNAMRDTMNAGPRLGDLWSLLVAPVALILLAWLVARLMRRETDPTPAPPVDYFARALSLLQLDPQERQDLKALVSAGMISYPAHILLSPANLAHALRSHGVQKNEALRLRLEALSLKLFNAPLPPPPPLTV